jgi:hypothetical protein
VRARWIVLIVIASNLVLLAVMLAVVFGVRAHDRQYRFDLAKWHTEEPGDCNDEQRRPMIDDLAKNYLRAGITRDSVRFLLGEPAYKESPRVWVYDTGLLVSDCVHFTVVFEGNKLVDWTHRQK